MNCMNGLSQISHLLYNNNFQTLPFLHNDTEKKVGIGDFL